MTRLVPLLCLVACGGSTELAPDGRLSNDLDAILKRLTSPRKGGVSIVVERGSERLYEGSRGLADRDAGDVDYTATTPTYVADLAMPLTAAMILQDREAGRLPDGDRIDLYVPDLPAWMGQLQPKQLITHEAGVPDFYALAGSTDPCHADLYSRTDADMLALLVEAIPDFQPETDAAYSPSNYLLASLTLQAVNGEPFPILVRDRFAEPLGLSNTWGRDGLVNPPGTRAVGHNANGNGCDAVMFTTGHGGLVASTEDLITLGHAFNGDTILPRGVMKTAEAPLVEALAEDTIAYGQGWMLSPAGWPMHTGEFGAFHASWIRNPDTDTVIVVTTNGGIDAVHDLALQIADHDDLQ